MLKAERKIVPLQQLRVKSMDIAQTRRKENIAEYILYLWQIEDLLRALQFSPEAIYSQLVAPRNLPEQNRELFLLWYMVLPTCFERRVRRRVDTLTIHSTLSPICIISTCNLWSCPWVLTIVRHSQHLPLCFRRCAQRSATER